MTRMKRASLAVHDSINYSKGAHLQLPVAGPRTGFGVIRAPDARFQFARACAPQRKAVPAGVQAVETCPEEVVELLKGKKRDAGLDEERAQVSPE